MRMNDYQMLAGETAVYQDIMYPIASLMIEAAEFADLFVKPLLRGDDIEATRKEIISEAGDVLWNLAVSLKDQGITLGEVAEFNIAKLQDRRMRDVLKGSGGDR